MTFEEGFQMVTHDLIDFTVSFATYLLDPWLWGMLFGVVWYVSICFILLFCTYQMFKVLKEIKEKE